MTDIVSSSNPIKIFFHIFAKDLAWERIVSSQMTKLLYSGLLFNCTACYVTIIGPDAEFCAKFVRRYPRTIVTVDPNNQTLERVTLLDIHNKVDDNDYILYIHSKGVTKNYMEEIIRIEDWRNLMEWYLIHKYEKCIALLKDYDTVGLNYYESPYVHYSGNFWWSRGSHYKKLSRRIGPSYLDSERYLFSVKCNSYCIYHSHTNHYNHRYPMELYIYNEMSGDTSSS